MIDPFFFKELYRLTTRRWICLYIMCMMSVSYCYSEESNKQTSQVSEDLAQVLWKIMEAYENEYVFEELFVNLWKLNTGRLKSKPLSECYGSLLAAIEKKAEEKYDTNLQKVNHYLKEIKQMDDFHEVIEDKVYYEIVNLGSGKMIQDLNSSPLISFTEKTLNGRILSENRSGIRLPLKEVISGLRIGLIGMREGELRRVFIHPDFAYKEIPKPEPFSMIIIELSLLAL